MKNMTKYHGTLMVRCWDLLPIYFFISTLTIWWWLLILIKYQPCCILSEIMGLFNNIDVLQANCFSVRWWKTRQCYEDRCIFCGLKNPSAESQMGFKITKPYPGRAEASTNTHTSLYRHVITQTGKAEVCTSNFQLKGFSLSNFNFDYFFCQNIMVTVFPVFLCRKKSLIILDFRLSILIITKGSPLRFFHFSSVFRFVDSRLSPFAPVWGQAGLAATLCWMSCWIWLNVKEWWTSTTVSRPSAPDASTWSRLKWVGELTLLD